MKVYQVLKSGHFQNVQNEKVGGFPYNNFYTSFV